MTPDPLLMTRRNMNWPEAWAAVHQLPSAITEAEANALWRLARAATNPIVEIGTWQGRGGALLYFGALASRQARSRQRSDTGWPALPLEDCMERVSTVDPYLPWRTVNQNVIQGDRSAAIRNIQSIGVHVASSGPFLGPIIGRPESAGLEMVHLTSEQAAVRWGGGPIGLLFIDGDHFDVMGDFVAWAPHLPSGSVIAFHDYVPSDPRFARVVSDVDALVSAGEIEFIQREGSLYVARRT